MRRTTAVAAAAAATSMLTAAGVAAGVAAGDPAGDAGPQRLLPDEARGALADPFARQLQERRAEHRRAARRRARAARRRAFPVAVAQPDYGEAAARFGNDRGDHAHAGQDVFAPAGTPVRAVEDATVVEAGSDGSRGNFVALHSARTNRTYAYFHLQAPATVAVGERVRAGRRIGRVGCTGRCFGDHLHFEVHRGASAAGPAKDPLPLLRRWQRRAR